MTADTQDLLSFALRSSIQDDAGLKTTWYSHVLKTLEKLDNHMDKIYSELYKQRDEFRKELYDLREKMRSETVDDRSLEILEKHIDEMLTKLDSRVAQLEQTDGNKQLKSDIDVIKHDISKYKQEWTDQITISSKSLKEELVELFEPIKNKVITLEVKIGFIGVISGMIGSGIVGVVVLIIKSTIAGGTP